MAKIELISGKEGQCLAINNIRIVGPKPWGGGRIIKRWTANDKDILEAVNAVKNQNRKEKLKCQKENL